MFLFLLRNQLVVFRPHWSLVRFLYEMHLDLVPMLARPSRGVAVALMDAGVEDVPVPGVFDVMARPLHR